jgi:hypothetical protein
VYYPCLVARLLPLRVAVGEATLWRLITCVGGLSKLAAGSTAPRQHTAGAAAVGSSLAAGGVEGAGAGGAAGAAPSARHQQVHADMPLIINFMNVEEVQLSLSFKPDPASRRIANQVGCVCVCV